MNKLAISLAVGLCLQSYLPTSFAGEAAELNVIGFSKDGKYLAFEQYGITDGEGAAYSEIFVVDTADNDFEIKPIQSKTDGTPEDAVAKVRATNLKLATDEFKKFNIEVGLTGKHVISHLPTDLKVDPKTAQFSFVPPLAGTTYTTYTLTLTEQTAKAENCPDGMETKKLTLKLQDDALKSSHSLQEDKGIPKTRGCPLSYRIQDVYVLNQNTIAVFLNMFTLGNEGQNMRYLVMTGRVRTPAK